MTLDYSSPGKVKIDMRKYVKDMIADYSENIDYGDVANPAMTKLFQVDPDSIRLPKKKQKYSTHLQLKGYFYQSEATQTSIPPYLFCVPE